MLIGLDFDNTLISYGHVFKELAVEAGLVPETIVEDKLAVRTHVWAEHDDIAWQHLQAATYGPEIGRGRFMAGAPEFMRLCRKRGVGLCVVSHKTKYAAIDPGGCDLQLAARGWMEKNGFFRSVEEGGFGFGHGDVYFETERAAKVARINSLRCNVFIDDLVEVLSHEDLDESIERILFQEQDGKADCCSLAGPWLTISHHIFSGESQ